MHSCFSKHHFRDKILGANSVDSVFASEFSVAMLRTLIHNLACAQLADSLASIQFHGQILLARHTIVFGMVM